MKSLTLTNEQIMIDQLVNNIDHYKEMLKPFVLRCKELLEKENKVFESDINKQFDEIIKWLIASELSNKVQVPLDEAYVFIEDKDLKELLK